MIRLYDIFAYLLAAAILVIGAIFFHQFLTNAASATDVWPPWLTLLGVISALFIAVWQQEKISQREENMRKRKSVAARAILPTVLDDVASYAKLCLDKLSVYGGRARSVNVQPLQNQDGLFTAPAIPIESLLKIQDCIEHADAPHQKSLAELIRKVQVQNIRLRSLERYVSVMPDQIASSVVDALIVYAWCERLFPYSRLETDDDVGPLASAEVLHAALVHGYENREVVDCINQLFD